MVVKKTEDGPSTPSKASQAPKDLITLMNSRNGETYKFACKTCIDGHRAPLCDPKKHRGKIMFRRPAPGRPARQCGHPKAAKCDCLAKRTLCCVLSNEQWDLVEQGQIVEVSMYDSREDLDSAQIKPSTQSQSTSTTTSEPASTPVTNGSFSSASTPLPQPPLQMFGVGVPPGDSKPSPDTFGWTGEVPPVSVHDLAPQYQPMPPPNFVPQSSPPYQYFANNMPPQMPGMMQEDVHRGSISQHSLPHGHWPQPRPEYMPFDQPQFIPPQDQHFDALRLEQMHLSPNIRAVPGSHAFLQPSHDNHFTTASQHDIYQPLPVPALHDFTMDTNMSMQVNFDPSQPPDDMQDVTQSCCSSKRTQSQQTTATHNWQFPPSAPTQQFPCPRCASTMCQCTNCPEVMQNPLQNGAWARACGRSGHLDAEEFLNPIILEQHHVPQPHAVLQQQQQVPMHQQQQQQQQTPASTPSTGRSCCGGSSGTVTAQNSPFAQPIHDATQWHQPYQSIPPQQILPYDGNGIVMDGQILYPQQDWQNMR